MKRRAVLGFIIGACSLPECALADFSLLDGGQKRAMDLYRAAAAGSEDALQDLRARANEGDRWSAMQYGFLHHTGRAPKVGKSISIAMKAYRKACKLAPDSTAITGNQFAAHNMGIIYLWGDDDIDVDAAEAAKWFTAAAGDETHPLVPAAMNLANLYEHGFGNVPQDLAAAGRWYRAAASRKEPYALYKLGYMLMNGIGMSPNQFEGKLKLVSAAEQWSCDAMYLLSQIAISPSTLADKNPVESAKWLLIAAEGDNRYKKAAQEALGKLNQHDQSTAKGSARSWIQFHSRIQSWIDYRLPINEDSRDV